MNEKKKEDLGDDGTPTTIPAASVIVMLSEPLVIEAQKTNRLELRAPKGADVRRCGLPFMVQMASNDGFEDDGDDDEMGQVNMNAVCKYISRLGAVPKSQVDEMPADDIMRCFQSLTPFFDTSETTRKTS